MWHETVVIECFVFHSYTSRTKTLERLLMAQFYFTTCKNGEGDRILSIYFPLPKSIAGVNCVSSTGQFVHLHQAMSPCMSRTALFLMISVSKIPDLKASRIQSMSNQHQKSSRLIKLLLYQILALSRTQQGQSLCSGVQFCAYVLLFFWHWYPSEVCNCPFLRSSLHAKNEWMSYAVGVYIFLIIKK